jgi:hypothetical protein
LQGQALYSVLADRTYQQSFGYLSPALPMRELFVHSEQGKDNEKDNRED